MARSKPPSRPPAKPPGSTSTRAAQAARAAAALAETAPTVIYVHGIGRHVPSAELKLEWDLALFGRDMGERSCMAYWADIVYPVGPAGPGAARVRARAPSGLDIETVLRNAGVDPEQPGARELVQALLLRAGVAEASAAGPRKRVLPLPGSWRRPLARRFLEALVGDAAAYFFNADARKRIQQRLDHALQAAAPQVTIVAHSLGSVVAYEVLAALRASGAHSVQLITLGSPLGVQEVQDFLVPPNQPVPVVVKQWHNFADPLDPVALDKSIANDFAPNGFIRDQTIVNTRNQSLFSLDPHSAVGYLAHTAVRRVVHDILRLDHMSRFILARDVAERLGAEPQQRHPVLIEVLEPGYPALAETPQDMQARECAAAEPGAAHAEAAGAAGPAALADRIAQLARQLERLVADVPAARIDPLQRFVAAHLTAAELRAVAAAHRELRVYSVWRSSRKAKLTTRSLRTLKADAAFASFGAAGQGITWAVLDTGVRADHPHFAGGLVEAVWDCTRPGPPVSIANAKDADGHGTHVAGIIAGREAGGAHRGVAPSARLVVYRVLDDKGEGEDAWIIKALDHIAARNANSGATLQVHGVNLSLGGPFDATVYGCGFSPVCAELRRQWRDGVLVVVACGNEGQLQVQTASGEVDLNTAISIGDPANLDDCIAVGSVNADKPHLYGVSSFSSRGPTADGRPKPDVVAPGERISSCNANFHTGKGDLYYEESGTSMAAPHVSGLLAAFLSVRREFIGRPDEVKRILLESSTDLGRDRYHQGRGLPNLMQMLLSV